jgi:hypothetical protein
MPKEKDTAATEEFAAAPEMPARPEEEPGKARFIVNGQVVDAEGKVVEGLSVGKDGSITGKEKESK